MQSILSFGAHAFPDVPSRNCPKSQCSSWRFAPVPPVRTGRGYGVDTGPLPAAGAAWSGAAQDAVTGGGRQAWKADCTQRPYTRLRGSAGAGWSGAARDDVAGGGGGVADSDCAQRPYTRLRGSAGAGWSGAARDDVAGGCGGARIRTARNDPIRGCMGRPGRDGRGPRGTARQAVAAGRGMRTARNDPIRGCAGRRAAMVGGRVGRRGRPWGGARNANCAQRPYTGYAAGPRHNWGGVPEGVAFGFGEPRNANLEPTLYTGVRVNWPAILGPAPESGAGGCGQAPNAGFVQRPYSGASASRRWTERTRARSAGKRRWIPVFDSALPRWRWVALVRKIAPRKDATQRGAVA